MGVHPRVLLWNGFDWFPMVLQKMDFSPNFMASHNLSGFFENRILTVFMAANCAFASVYDTWDTKNHLCTSVHVFIAVLAWFFASMEQPSAKSFLLWKCENLYYFYWFWPSDVPPNFPEKSSKSSTFLLNKKKLVPLSFETE